MSWSLRGPIFVTLLALGAAALVSPIVHVHAQPGAGTPAPDAPADAPPASTAPIQMPGVTVPGLLPQGYVVPEAAIGTKTDAPILQIPFSVQVVPRALMDDQGVTELKDALKNVSGVIPGGYYEGWDYYRIRGFDATGFTFVDGLQVDPLWWFLEEPFGLERVEVLKGPASALYGQGSLGGIVSLVSKRPRAERSIALHAGGGSFGSFEAGIDVGGALDEDKSVLGRLNALYRRRGSFVDFVDPSERWFAAPSLTWRLGPDTTLTLLSQYVNDDNFTALPLVAEGTVLPNPNGSLPVTRNTGEPDFPNEHKMWRVQLGYELTHRFDSVFSLRQVARASWNDVKTSWLYNDTLQDDLRTLTRYALRATDWYWLLGMDTALTARFKTGPVGHEVLAGVDYAYMDRTYRSATAAVGPIDLFDPVYGSPVGPFQPDYSWVTRSDAIGVYLQEQATLFDRLTLLAGGRVDLAWNEVREGFPVADTTLKANDTAFSPRLGLVYELVPGVSAYASYAQSFLPQPGYLQADGAQVDPERGEQWEVGLKTRLFGGRLTAGMAAYQLARENVATSNPENPNFYRVIGKQRSRGVELDAAIRLLPGWDLLFAYAYTDAKVLEDNDFPAGDRTQNVPRHAVNVWTKYEIQDGPLRGLGFGAGGRYYSDQAADLPNTFDLPAYGIFDLAAFYTRGPVRLQVNVNNVLDKRYFPAAYSREYVLPGEPLNVTATLTWTYDLK